MLEKAKPLASLDNWVVAFDIWCMLHENDYHLLINQQKAIAYSCNFYCLSILRKNKNAQLFFQTHEKDPKMLVIFSYYLAVEMLKWTESLLQKRPEGVQLMERNHTRDYFLLHQIDGILDDPTHSIYIEQKLTTSLLAQDYRQTDSFVHHVKRAIHQAQIHS